MSDVSQLSIFELAERVGPALTRLKVTAKSVDMDMEDLIFFLILGSMNLRKSGQMALWVPVTMEALGERTGANKDNIRRRFKFMEDRGLIQKMGRSGFIVSDMDTWRGLGEALASTQSD